MKILTQVDKLEALRKESLKYIKQYGVFKLTFKYGDEFTLDTGGGQVTELTDKKITYDVHGEEFTCEYSDLLVTDVCYIADNLITWLKTEKKK